MDNKRYYWIKLKTDFFNQDTIDFLLSQKNGCEYVVLYQMLCLKTANNNGLLATNVGEIIVPYDINKIARDTRYFNVDTIRVALELYKQLGLIYEGDNSILQITGFGEMIGSETNGAKRIREWRQKKNLLQCNNNVTQEIEIDKEIDIDIEKDIYNYIESNFARTLNQVEIEQVQKWLSLYDTDIIKEAIKTALLQNKKNFKYITGILNNWQGKTLDEIKKEETKDTKPEWYGKDIPKEQVSDKELKELEDMFKDFK